MTDGQAFEKLVSSLYFHQVGYDDLTLEEWVSQGTTQLSADERSKVKRYLGNLLNDQKSDQELQKVWVSAGPDVLIPDNKQLRLFLKMVEEML